MRLKSVIRVSMHIRELMTLTQCTADAEKDVGMKKLKLEEAIATLQDMKVHIPVPKAAVMQTKRNVALDMAIDALKCSEMPNGSDTIYRQAAIEATWEEPSYTDPMNVLTEVRDRIKALPSAQPEITLVSAIDYLHSIGWMQEHDRILSSAQPERCEDCENFSKTRLLIPQPDIIRCRDCKYGEQDDGGWWYCRDTGYSMGDGEKGDGFCSYAERKTDE